MHSVRCSVIVLFMTAACADKSDHGFISGDGTPGPGLDMGMLEPWGDCSREPSAMVDNDYVVQTFPPDGSRNVSAYTPLVAFLGDGFDAADVVADDFEVRADNHLIDGRLTILDRGETDAIAWVPNEPYGSNVGVHVSFYGPTHSTQWIFHTGPFEAVMAGNQNLSFENLAGGHGVECEETWFTDNFKGWGDVAITNREAGATDATDGYQRLLMTTGEVLGNAAVRGTTSFVTSQPLAVGGERTISFDYRFISEEFNGYVDTTVHDDGFMMIAYGQNGAIFDQITSVNDVGEDGADAAQFPGLQSAASTEWERHISRGFDSLGADITLTFILTDVGAYERTSAVALDAIRIE